MERVREQVPSDPGQAMEHIATSGDTAHILRRFNPTRTGLEILAGTASVAFVGGMNTLPGGDLLLTTPVYAGATAAVAAWASYRRDRAKEAAYLPKAERLQETVRRGFEQPVDIFKHKLRWYGFDTGYHNANFEPVTVLDEFERLVALGKRHGHETVIYSSNIFGALGEGEPQEVERYGYMVNGRRSVHSDIIDRYADETAVQATTEQAENLIADLRLRQDRDTVNRLVERLEQSQPNHPFLAIYNQTDYKNDEAARKKLESVLQRAIEERISDSSMVIDRGESGLGYTRLKAHRHAALVGRNLHTSTESRSLHGEARRQPDGNGSLLMSSGYGSMDELLRDIETNPGNSYELSHKVMLALWHIVGPKAARVHADYHLDTMHASRLPIHKPFQARLLDELPVSGPRLKPYGNEKDETTATLEYRPHHWRSRCAVAIGSAAIWTCTVAQWGHSFGHGIDKRVNTLENQLAKQPGNSRMVDRQTAERYLSAHHSPGNLLTEGGMKLTGTMDAIQRGILSGYHRLGVGTAWAERLGRPASGNGLNPNHRTPNLYLDPSGIAFFGDVDASQNAVAWQLAPSNGAQTAGYWAEAVETSLNIAPTAEDRDFGQPTPPFKNLEIDLEDDTQNFMNGARVERADHNLRMAAHEPYIVVSSQAVPYYATVGIDDEVGLGPPQSIRDQLPRNGGYVLLQVPVLEGYSIAQATVGTYNNENLPGSDKLQTLPTYVVTQRDGTQQLILDVAHYNNQTALDVAYTLVPQAAGLAVHRPSAVGYVQVPGGPRGDLPPTLSEVVNRRMRNSVWQAMPGGASGKLPASGNAVAAAVSKSHRYSFTPMADGHITSSINAGDAVPDGQVLETMGKTLAANRYANCNTAGLLTLILTGGKDRKNYPLAPAVGFHNGNDNQLTQQESHMWLVNSNGDIEDPTPTLAELPKDDSSSSLLRNGEIALGVLTLGYLGLASRRRLQRRRLAQATARLLPEDPAAIAEAHRNISQLEAALYAPDKKQPSEKQLAIQAERAASRKTLAERYDTLPHMSHRRLRQLQRHAQSDFKRFLGHLSHYKAAKQ